MSARVEHERLEPRRRLSEVVQCPVDLRQITFITREYPNAVRVQTKPRHAGPKGRLGLCLILLTEAGQRGKKNDTVPNQRLEHVVLHDGFLPWPETKLDMTMHHLLERVFKQVNLPVSFDEGLNSTGEYVVLC